MTDIKVTNNQIRPLFDAVKDSCGEPLVKYLQYRSSKDGISRFAFTNKADKEAVNFILLKFDLPENSYGNL